MKTENNHQQKLQPPLNVPLWCNLECDLDVMLS